MAAPKGTRPPAAGKGRVKGTPNKVTGDLRAMILAALDDAGGQKYLAQQAEANPGAFMTLVGKVLPTTLAGVPGQPIELTIRQITSRVIDADYTDITDAIVEAPVGDEAERRVGAGNAPRLPSAVTTREV